MERRSERIGWRWWILCLTAFGTGGCSALLQGVARTAADEAIGDSGPPRSVAADPAARAADGSRAHAPAARDASASTPSSPQPAPSTVSTYESTPMLGLSTPSFARPYSLMGSAFSRPATVPACQVGMQLHRGDFVYAPEVTLVDASGPLDLRVARPGMPLYQLFARDPDSRSARAFHSGAVLSGGSVVCGRSFALHYIGLSLGWGVTTPFAVSR